MVSDYCICIDCNADFVVNTSGHLFIALTETESPEPKRHVFLAGAKQPKEALENDSKKPPFR